LFTYYVAHPISKFYLSILAIAMGFVVHARKILNTKISTGNLSFQKIPLYLDTVFFKRLVAVRIVLKYIIKVKNDVQIPSITLAKGVRKQNYRINCGRTSSA